MAVPKMPANPTSMSHLKSQGWPCVGEDEEASPALLTCGRDDPPLLAGMVACPGPGSWLIPKVLAWSEGHGEEAAPKDAREVLSGEAVLEVDLEDEQEITEVKMGGDKNDREQNSFHFPHYVSLTQCGEVENWLV